MGEKDSIAEKDAEKRAAAKARIKRLAVVCALAVVARIFIKAPPPPKPAEHKGAPFRAIPGVLKNLTPVQKATLTPTQLALLKEADNNALKGNSKPQEALAKTNTKPTEVASYIIQDQQDYQKQLFHYEQKKILAHVQEDEPPANLSQTMLVVFRGGGYTKAVEAERTHGKCDIRIDKNMRANIPGHMIVSISNNALKWKEPVPKGFTRIKPAKGITITVASNIAKRITIQKQKENEI